MKTTHTTVLAIALLFILISCDKSPDEDKLIQVDFTHLEQIDRILLMDASTYNLEGVPTLTWSSDDGIKFTNNNNAKTYLEIPDNSEPSNSLITLTSQIGKFKNTITKSIPIPAMELHRKYGLGNRVNREKSNNRKYNWYIDQGNTGRFSRINCGPACTAMAIHWNDEFTKVTTELLRDNSGLTGWWYTNNVFDYLESENINCKYINFADVTDLKNELDKNYIAILCLDIYYVRTSLEPRWRKDKFYNTEKPESGHFIIVKGYKETDSSFLLECYDPWSLESVYSDGQFKGMDRYYRMEDILDAAAKWWKYAIIIQDHTFTPIGIKSYHETAYLNPKDVPVQWGK